MAYIGPASEQALREFLAKSTKLPQHYWVSEHGLVFNVATIPVCPGKKKNQKKKYKYLGFTFDSDYPKKLNTGRLLHEHKPKKKAARNFKKLTT